MEKFAKGGIVKDGLFIKHPPCLYGNIETPIIRHSEKLLDSVTNAVAKALREQKGSITVSINGKENSEK